MLNDIDITELIWKFAYNNYNQYKLNEWICNNCKLKPVAICNCDKWLSKA